MWMQINVCEDLNLQSDAYSICINKHNSATFIKFLCYIETEFSLTFLLPLITHDHDFASLSVTDAAQKTEGFCI